MSPTGCGAASGARPSASNSAPRRRGGTSPAFLPGPPRGCFAIIEPDADSDPRRQKTSARLRNGKWHISGEKWFVTSYNASDFIIVHAHVDDDPDKPTLFLVDKPVENMMHLRSPKFMHNFAFDHAEIRFEEAMVGEDGMLGGSARASN